VLPKNWWLNNEEAAGSDHFISVKKDEREEKWFRKNVKGHIPI